MKTTVIVMPDISQEALQVMLDIVSDGVWDWHADTNFVYRSPGWYRMLGYTEHGLENTVLTWESLIHPEDYDRVMSHFDDHLCQKVKRYKAQYRCRCQDGSYLWIEDTAQIVESHPDGSVVRMIGAHRDLSVEKRLQLQAEQKSLSLQEIVDAQTKELLELNQQLANKIKEVESLARKDSLTALFNRHHFNQKLKTECARAARFNEPLSLVAIDVDNLKPINDNFGHPAGDLALVKVAGVLQDNIRQIDIPVRWGGDEFMLLLPNTTADHAAVLSEKLRALIADLRINTNISTSASFGITQFDTEESYSAFVIRADNALYQAKSQGGNQVCHLSFD